MHPPKHILVINVSRIGDTLAATPAIQAIHGEWPQAHITVLGSPHRIDVIDNLPGVSKIAAITKNTAFFRGRFSTKVFDLAVVYNYDEPLVSYAIRVSRHVVAFRQKSPYINERLFLQVDPAEYPTEHITEHFLRLPAALGIYEKSCRIRYHCRPEEVITAKLQLKNRGFIGKHPVIGLQIASFPTKSYRDWPVESFMHLCQLILQSWPQAGFLIFGGKEERQRSLWLKQQLGNHACLLAGQLSLRETAAIMSLTDLYVGVDTGPTHLMSSFDIPIIGLYHPKHPSKNLGPKDHPLNFSLDHPYDDRLYGEPLPMSDITVNCVFGQAKRALATMGFTQSVKTGLVSD